MGVFENLPYTNFHELNLDWIIEKLKNIEVPQEAAERAEAAAETAEQAAASALSQIGRVNVLTRTTVNQDLGSQAAGSHLMKSGYTVAGSIGYLLTGTPSRGSVLASGLPKPSGGTYTLIGHKMDASEEERDHVIICRLFATAPDTWPDLPDGSLVWWYGSVTAGQEVFFDAAYITSDDIG